MSRRILQFGFVYVVFINCFSEAFVANAGTSKSPQKANSFGAFQKIHPSLIQNVPSQSQRQAQHLLGTGEPNADKETSSRLFGTGGSSSLKRVKKIQRLVLVALLVLTGLGRLITSGGTSSKSLTYLGQQLASLNIVTLLRGSFKKAAKVTLLTALMALAVDAIRTRKRQAVDPTSEWGRYARHPNLRGLATAHMLLVQVLPLALIGRFFPKLQQKAGERFAEGLLRIGPLYIKVGQIISSQSQRLPASWKTSLERLQDQVPAQSGAAAQALAYSVWPGGKDAFHSTFESVDWNPVAAASLGQVHRAQVRAPDNTLRNVALKLQRPYLRQIYDNDFAMMKVIAKGVDKFLASSAGSVGGVTQSWSKIFRNAESILYREIDYRDEAANAMRFAEDFGLDFDGNEATSRVHARNGKPLPSAASWLRTPIVYGKSSSEQVLVMEFVPSIKATDIASLQRANVTMADREYLADCLARAYLRQFCSNGFFSTDPHAGNLGVEILNTEDASLPPEKRVRLVFYDFGQAAELRPEQTDGVLDIIAAIVDMDVNRSVESFQKMGVLKDNADLDVVRAKIADNYRTGSVSVNRKRLASRGYHGKDHTTAQHDANNETKFSDSQVMSYFTLPAEYAFVARALTQLDGVGKTLDPTFDFVSAAAPWMYEVKGVGVYVKEEATKWIQRTFRSSS